MNVVLLAMRLARCQSAQGVLEYTLIITLVSVLGIAALTLIGKATNDNLNNVALHLAL
jgi:Flp pilus assembly pilin Flp